MLDDDWNKGEDARLSGGEGRKPAMNLTIRDGFNFGCGFFVAAALYSLAVTVLIFVMFAVFSAIGTSLLGAFLQ